ncbi:MAG: YciI family protein [Burkholderiales bacterium]
MKYLCLICAETSYMMESLSPAERAAHFAEYGAFIESIRNSGHFIGGNRLLPPEAAATVRVRNGKVTTTDGPYAETKEHLGGYFMIEAKDLNEAILIASRIPGAKFGCVEVRPVAEDVQTMHILKDGGPGAAH